jgi:hypothetical protein
MASGSGIAGNDGGAAAVDEAMSSELHEPRITLTLAFSCSHLERAFLTERKAAFARGDPGRIIGRGLILLAHCFGGAGMQCPGSYVAHLPIFLIQFMSFVGLPAPLYSSYVRPCMMVLSRVSTALVLIAWKDCIVGPIHLPGGGSYPFWRYDARLSD